MTAPIPRLLIGPGVSMKRSLKTALSVDGPPLLLTARAFSHVVGESDGSTEAAWRWLGQRVRYGRKPVLVNVEHANGESTTIALAPMGWSPEKLRGYIGGLGEALEEEFGEVSRVWSPGEEQAS